MGKQPAALRCWFAIILSLFKKIEESSKLLFPFLLKSQALIIVY